MMRVIACRWMAFQVCVILLQDRYGPRFFIPKQMLPPKYDYYHKIDTGGEEKDVRLPVAMNVVERERATTC